MSSIATLVAARAEQFGARTAIVDGSLRLSYAELFDEGQRFGAALINVGVRTGDRVAIWHFNSAHWVIAALGTFQAGAVVVPINTRFKGPEAADLLRRSRSRVLVTTTDFLARDYVAMLSGIDIDLPDLHTVVVAHGEPTQPAHSWEEFIAAVTTRELAHLRRRSAALGADDVSDILFTSGTTGTPKGVVMTHGRTLRVASDWTDMTGLDSSDRYLMVNPYFHMFGLKAGILASIHQGATMLPHAVFDVEHVLSRIAAERITVLPGPPALYQSILDAPDLAAYDLSSLRVGVTGAADIPVELIRRIHDELPFSSMITGYGLTEAGTACATSNNDDIETIARTVGRPRPGFELRLVDEAGSAVTSGAPGEVLIRGPSVMVGYLDDPAETASALSEDGWLRTADLGVLSDDGCLEIVGRLKDMFIVGGFNAYPAEIENSLLRHPAVRQAAVIGIPDARLGEVGMAFVVVTRDDVSGDEIIAWCHGQMANYKVPRAVRVLDHLPVSATGKVLKNELRSMTLP